jgi:hypothetical protein
MKRIAILAALLAACGTSNPSKPAIAATQIDRMGRAAVNTALTNPFGVVAGKTTDGAKDEYNASVSPAEWGTKFSAEIATNLAILDSLDGTCGNQLAAGATATAGRYGTLAGVLADDRLYVRTTSTTCGLYLALEADATGLTSNNGDCGGRTPLENTIDETYSLLAIGKPSGVTNGITVDGEGAASATAFPFLGNPN